LSEFSTTKDICERIFLLEAEHNLLDYEVDGVKVWQYLRMHIYYALAQKCGVLSNPHPLTNSLLHRVRRYIPNLRSIMFHNPFFSSKPIDALFLDHPRSEKYEGHNIDIYTYFLLEKMAGECKQVCILERANQGIHSRSLHPNRKHIDAIHMCRLFSMLIGRGKCTNDGLQRINWINQLIRNAFCVDIDLHSLLIGGVKRFKINYCIYTKLLARLKPKRLFVVVAYGYLGEIIRAAKDAGIEVVEIQHGVFSKYHLGYSFPGRKNELDYFPDVLLTWGRYWSELMEFPISRNKVIDFGFEYFHRMKAKHSNTCRKKGQILILSQGAIGLVLAKKILDLVDELTQYKLIYKLHPNEYSSWQDNSDLRCLSKKNNVHIVDRNHDLYHLFAESEYQFGVFSTAIFEGIGMGCKTVLLDLPGVEYMANLVDRGLAVLHREGKTLQTTLRDADNIQIDHSTKEMFGYEHPVSEYAILS